MIVGEHVNVITSAQVSPSACLNACELCVCSGFAVGPIGPTPCNVWTVDAHLHSAAFTPFSDTRALGDGFKQKQKQIYRHLGNYIPSSGV